MRVSTTETLRQLIHPLSGAPTDLDPLLRLAESARTVVIGTETAGSHQILRDRALITRRLIEDLGFDAVLVDVDCIAAARVDRFVRGHPGDRTSEESLRDFRRFPQWIMRNSEVVEFVGWLRSYNERARRAHVIFHGLDLLGLHTSMETILAYLDAEDAEGAAEARWRFSCLEQFTEDDSIPELEMARSREEMLLREHVAARRAAIDDPMLASMIDCDAQQFYRALLHGRPAAWAYRNRAMLLALDLVRMELSRTTSHPKVVIWTSNFDSRDSRFVTGGRNNTFGSMLRQRHGEELMSIALTTFSGTITASARWGSPPERMRLLPAVPESYESMFYDVDCPHFLVTLRDKAAAEDLVGPHLLRCTGAVYQPETERRSHYYSSRLAEQFDAVVHSNQSRATEVL